MKVREYLPNYYEGFELKEYEFETLRQLYDLPIFKKLLEKGWFLTLSYESTMSHIVAFKKDKDSKYGCKWYVVGIIDGPSAKNLFFWGMPDYKSIMQCFEFLNDEYNQIDGYLNDPFK